VWREVEGTLAQLPGERTAEADDDELADLISSAHPADELARRRVARRDAV